MYLKYIIVVTVTNKNINKVCIIKVAAVALMLSNNVDTRNNLFKYVHSLEGNVK